MTFTFRPPTFMRLQPDQMGIELDRALPRLYDAHASLDGVAIKAPAFGTGYVIDTGSLAITGSKLAIQTRLTTVQQVVVSIENGATATNITATARVTPANTSQIDIFCWQPTSASVTTPVASTSSVIVHWSVSGTQSTVQT